MRRGKERQQHQKKDDDGEVLNTEGKKCLISDEDLVFGCLT